MSCEGTDREMGSAYASTFTHTLCEAGIDRGLSGEAYRDPARCVERDRYHYRVR